MDVIIPDNIIKGTISAKKEKTGKYEKVKIDRINIKETSELQFSLYTAKQVFHKNMNDTDGKAYIAELLEKEFNQAEIFTSDFVYGYRITSKGKVLSNKKKASTDFVVLDHNKKKNYLIEEGMIVPPLIDLGVMMPDGKVVKAHYDKFKQINRFLEIIEDGIKDEKSLKIIDFGCGKSYLTFIIYYYLTVIKKIECSITGLDLKEDVIDHCNEIARKYNYTNLKFIKGNIADFDEKDKIDMIVTLHACDTATDYALYYAIKMKCRYIFSVPCCQHEINLQLDTNNLHYLTKFGIMKERFSALLTDSIRANILQYAGYKTQVLEFVDFDASPKNLLIRAYLTENGTNEKIKAEIDEAMKQYNVHQTLYDLMFRQ